MTTKATMQTTEHTLSTRTSGACFATVGTVLDASGEIVAEADPRPLGAVSAALDDARRLARELRLPLAGDADLRSALSAQRGVVADLVRRLPEPLRFHHDGGSVVVSISPDGEIVITGRHDGADAAEIAALLPEGFVRAAQCLAVAVQERVRLSDLLGVAS